MTGRAFSVVTSNLSLGSLSVVPRVKLLSAGRSHNLEASHATAFAQGAPLRAAVLARFVDYLVGGHGPVMMGELPDVQSQELLSWSAAGEVDRILEGDYIMSGLARDAVIQSLGEMVDAIGAKATMSILDVGPHGVIAILSDPTSFALTAGTSGSSIHDPYLQTR